jgi:hypothetical protein
MSRGQIKNVKHKAQENRVFLNKWHHYEVIAMTLGVLALILAWVQTFYFLEPYNLKVGWLVRDGYFGDNFLIGAHSFSDFSAVIDWTQNKNPWDTPFNAYPPFPILIFKFWAILPDKIQLLTWLIAILVSIYIVLLNSTKSFEIESRMLKFVVFGVFSVPVLSALDRGNIIGFMPLLLYFYFKFKTSRLWTSRILLGLAIGIKIYPALLLLQDFKRRKFSNVVWPVLIGVFLNMVSIFTWKNPFGLLLDFKSNISNFAIKNIDGDPLFVSATSILNNILLKLQESNSNFNLLSENYKYVLVIIIIAIVLIAFNEMPEHSQFIVSLSLMQFVPLVSFNYTRIWTIVAFAVLFYIYSEKRIDPLQGSEKFLVLGIVLINTPLVLPNILGNSPTLLAGSCLIAFYVLIKFWKSIKMKSIQNIHLLDRMQKISKGRA